MRLRPLVLFAAMLLSGGAAFAATPVLVIHGGAGVMRADLTPETEALVRADLEAALAAGYGVLKDGGTSLDAVGKALVVLEDSPRFNAGKGAVFTHDGRNELDAAIMDGATLRAGAVAGVHRIKNPVLLARAVMDKSPHVLLVGDGAEAFAQGVGFELVDPGYFRTERRWRQLQEVLSKEAAGQQSSLGRRVHYGTVGAVALDRAGHLAAATSTGGMTNKRYGRVGDTPIVGAGTYAANPTCAVSATGHGEYFIRWHVAARICALIELAGLPVGEAATQVIETLRAAGGEGGVIALDGHGNFALPFNTPGMYRGWIVDDGAPVTAIFAADEP